MPATVGSYVTTGSLTVWIATPFGFLMPAIRPPDTVPSGDTRTLQVRSRRAVDLDILRAVYLPGKLGRTLHTPYMDYRYRAYCTPEAFGFAVAQMIVDIDYTKFKPQTDRFRDDALHAFYNRVWSVYNAAFPTPSAAYSGGYASGSPGSSATPAAVTGTATAPGPAVPSPGRAVVGVNLAREPAGTGWPRFELGPASKDYRSGYRRDDAAYEPDLGADPEPDDADSAVSTGDAILDDLHMRLEVLQYVISQDEPMSHTQCGHHSARARERCKRRQKRLDDAEVADLQAQIVTRQRELVDDEKTTAVAQSDSQTTVDASI